MEHRWWLWLRRTSILKATKAINVIPTIEFVSTATITTFILSTKSEFIFTKFQQSVPILVSIASN